MSITDYASSVATGASVSVPVDEITWGDFAPDVRTGASVAVPTDNMGLEDFAPEVEVEPAGYSFTMTAGDFAGIVSGYLTAEASGGSQVGSIDEEPIAGHPLYQFVAYNDGSLGGIIFEGDATADVAGKSVWVNGVEYPFDDADWTYDAGEDRTVGGWATGTPVFAPASVYPSEIK